MTPPPTPDADPPPRADDSPLATHSPSDESANGSAVGPLADRPAGDAHTSVPPGEQSFACEHCGRPFPTERLRSLHRGIAHDRLLSAAERDAYDEATADEERELRRYRIVALGALVILYFGFLLTYAVFA